MACNVCHGRTGCPLCREDQAPVTCPDCNGEGIAVWMNGDYEAITQAEHAALPCNRRYEEDCETCEGEGWIYEGEAPEFDKYE